MLTHPTSEYMWAAERRVPTLELKGTSKVVVTANSDRRIRYRFVQGNPGDRLILMRKLPSA